MSHGISRLTLLLCGCAFAFAVAALPGDLQTIPALTARVTDLTATLDASQKQALEAELAALELRKGAQLAVLIVPTTQPEDIAQYAIRVYDSWKLGRKNIDDGALLIVAKDDRSVRIEVARGLEGAIPDAAVARIIREYLTPRFREGDFYGGINAALTAMSALVDGESLPEPRQEPSSTGGLSDPFTAIFVGIFVAIWARTFFGRLSAMPRAGMVAASSGGIAWWLSSLIPLAIGLAVIGALIGFFGGGGGGFARRSGSRSWDGGGFGGGGFGGGGSWGGGSGGGFSGGGGISAGGGASGRW